MRHRNKCRKNDVESPDGVHSTGVAIHFPYAAGETQALSDIRLREILGNIHSKRDTGRVSRSCLKIRVGVVCGVDVDHEFPQYRARHDLPDDITEAAHFADSNPPKCFADGDFRHSVSLRVCGVYAVSDLSIHGGLQHRTADVVSGWGVRAFAAASGAGADEQMGVQRGPATHDGDHSDSRGSSDCPGSSPSVTARPGHGAVGHAGADIGRKRLARSIATTAVSADARGTTDGLAERTAPRTDGTVSPGECSDSGRELHCPC